MEKIHFGPGDRVEHVIVQVGGSAREKRHGRGTSDEDGHDDGDVRDGIDRDARSTGDRQPRPE